MPGLYDDELPSLLDRKAAESVLDVAKTKWTEDQMKMYQRGVEDNTTIVTFSIKVYYTIEVGERTGGRIADIVDIMIENLNKRFEKGGALARAELHCLEQMTWTEKEIRGAFNTVHGTRRIEGGSFDGTENYKARSKNSADAVTYISTYVDTPAWPAGRANVGGGLSRSLESFDNFYSWVHLGHLGVFHHELGHNLGNAHGENYTMWTNFLMKQFRFALAAIGDEQEPCPKQEADWEFKSRCFKSFGQYTGGELEEAGRTSTEKNAKECQGRCSATEGCSFFSFKNVGAGCHMSSAAAELTYAKGVVGGPVSCNTDGDSDVGTTSCVTNGGTAEGDSCSFPFEFKGVTYLNCTSFNHDQDWCYTDSGKWGNCNSDCKGGVPGCFKANLKYSPLDDFLGAQRSMELSGEACRDRCARDSQCAYFSFWEKELPDDNGCTLFGNSATFVRENETVLYITGPATCPDFDEPTECQGSSGCKCSPQLPCGVGEGDCDSKKDCQGNLVCGKDNCKGEWFKDGDDCCADIGPGCTNSTLCYDGDLDPKGATYDGCATTTVSGRTCQYWGSTVPHHHGNTHLWKEGNNCRNPTDSTRPWCYTNDPDVRWEFCEELRCGAGGPGCVNSTKCYDKDLDPNGEKFDGCVATTVSGRTCQAWASTSPHSHGYTSLWKESNNCRNPSNYNKGLWCFTTDPDVRWELCADLRCGAEDDE